MKKEVIYFVTGAVAEILTTMLNTVVVVIVLVFMQLVIFMFFYVLGRFGFKWTYKGS
jgi:hypothetical protein